MIGTSWLPGAVVLALGLLGGWLLSRRLRGGESGRAASAAPDRALEIADLEARRDEIYERLREQDLNPVDREDLESAAARTLRRLDELGVGRRRAAEPAASAAEPPPTAAAPAPRGFLLGFAYGAGLILIVGALVYWAVRDARPREEDRPAPMASTTEDPHGENLGDLPPAVAARLDSLAARLEADPGDLVARRETAMLQLSAGRFMEAFEEAERILASEPDNPDALYVQAVVRLTMGQFQPGAELLERALAENPRHVESLIARGIVYLQTGDTGQALSVWERGLEAAGGRHDGLERLLAMTRAGRPVEEILRAPRPGDLEAAVAEVEADGQRERPPAQAAGAVGRDAIPPAPPGAASGDYRARIVLAPGIEAPPGAVLFVFLRPGESGPPVAARRIVDPLFPLDISLGTADSMMGGALPDSGVLVAKLDSDGSASTSDPSDLETTAAATAGTRTLLTLGL